MAEWTGWKPSRKSYNSEEELGKEILAADPEAYKGRTPQELGKDALASGHPAFEGIRVVEGYSDIDAGRTAEDFGDKWLGVLGDVAKGFGNMLTTDPRKTVSSMANFGLTSADELYNLVRPEARGDIEDLHPSARGIEARLRSKTPITGGKGFLEGDEFKAPGALGGALGLLKSLDIGTTKGLDEARPAAQELARGFTPAGIEENLPESATNALAMLPQGRLLKALPPKVRSAAKLADPSTTLTEGARLALPPIGRGIKAAAGKGWDAAKTLGEGIAKPFQKLNAKIQKDIGTKGHPWMRHFAVSGGLGFTTSLGRNYWENYWMKYRDPQWIDAYRKTRSMEEADSAGRVTRRGLMNVAKVYDQLHEMYNEATERIFGGSGIATPSGIETGHIPSGRMIRTEGIVPRLKELAKGYSIDLDQAPDGQPMMNWDKYRHNIAKAEIEFSRDASRLETAKIAGESFEPGVLEQKKKYVASAGGSTIADVSTNRPTVEMRIEQFANLPETMPARELHRLRKLLDDAISTVSPDSDVSANTRGALVKMRNIVAEHLETQLADTEYPALMKKYSNEIMNIEDAGDTLFLVPGQINRYHRFPKELQEKVTHNLAQAMGEDWSKAGRIETIKWLEEAAGDPKLTPELMGALGSSWMGGGLVVRSETAQIGRAVAAIALGGTGYGVASVTGLLAALPALTLFSPRLASYAIDIMKESGEFSAAQVSKFKEAVQRGKGLDDFLGGEITRTFTEEGLTVANLMERSKEKGEENKGFWQTLGGVRAQPSGDRGVRLQQ